MYQAYAETKGWNWEVLNVSDGELGGYRVRTLHRGIGVACPREFVSYR